MNKEQYQQLKDVIINANPHVSNMEATNGFRPYVLEEDPIYIMFRPIRLADVLLAMRSLGDEGISFHRIELDYGVANFELIDIESDNYLEFEWNLLKDLAGQSEETREFLFRLLVKE